MKKVLSLVLAALMVAGTASVAFAAATEVEFVDDTGATWYTRSSDLVDVDGESKDDYMQGHDHNLLKPKSIELVKPGSTIYFKLQAGDTDDYEDSVKRMKVKANWNVGADLVESVKVEYIDAEYYVGVTTKAGVKTSLDDLDGEIKIYRSSPNNAWDTLTVNFREDGFGTVTFTEDPAVHTNQTDDFIVDTDSHNVKFKDLEDIVIEFDGVGEFEINVKDQDKLYLGFDHKAVTEIADKYDYAELEFVNFPGAPKFNRTGIFYLYVDEADSFVYALKDGKLEAVKATYDEEYEAMKFSLRNFPDSLIISDTELEIVNDETSSSEAPAEGETTPSETVKPNPGTGR